MLEKINWQPLMELLYPYPLYQVPEAPGKPVPFDELLREQRKRMATNLQEHHGLNCILMDPAWKAPKEEPTPKEKKCKKTSTSNK